MHRDNSTGSDVEAAGEDGWEELGVLADTVPLDEGAGVLEEVLGLSEEQPASAAVQAAKASIDAKILFIIRFHSFHLCSRKIVIYGQPHGCG